MVAEPPVLEKPKATLRIDFLDFMKGFSMLAIVVYHFFQLLEYGNVWQGAIRFGGTGVHAFLMLSGFGLYFSHFKKPNYTYRDFAVRRFGKIYIPYFLVLTAIVLINFAVPLYNEQAFAYLSHVFLFKMFSESWMVSYGYHFWFLSTIIQFYLIFPALARLMDKKPGAVLLASFAISLAWSVFIIAIDKAELRTWNSFFFQYFWEFALGMYLARTFHVHRKAFWELPVWQLAIVSGVGCALYGLLALKFGRAGQTLNDYAALAGFAAVGAFLFRLGIGPVNRFLLFVGKISFAFYLSHLFFRDLFYFLLPQAGLSYNLVFALVFAAVALALAYPIQQGIDKVDGWVMARLK